MKLPNLPLLHAYGNESVLLEKAAGYESMAARLAVGMLTANQSLNARAREEHLRAAADRMTEAMRELEAHKMRPVEGRMRSSRMPFLLMAGRPEMGSDGLGIGPALQNAPRAFVGDEVPLGMDDGMVRMASAIGQDLAFYSLEKDAGIGTAFGGMMGNIGKGLGAAGGGMMKGLGGALGRAGGAVAKAPAFAVGKLQGIGQAGQSLMASAKTRLQGALGTAAAGMENAGKNIQGKLQSFGASMEAKGKGLPAPGGMKPPPLPAAAMKPAAKPMPAPAAAATAAPKPAPTGGGTAPGGPSTPKQTAPQTGGEVPGGGFDLQKAWDRTGLSNNRWKWKLPALAAGAAGAYGLYAGARKGFEVLGRESEPAQYNAGGVTPAYGVNEYGAPDRSTPFMS